METIIMIGIALILFIPPIISIILGGANIGKDEEKAGEFLKKGDINGNKRHSRIRRKR